MKTKSPIDVWSDGSCWPNPGGPCKYGYVIRVRGGAKIKSGHKEIGRGKGFSNNVAEYAGLLAAMEWLIESELNGNEVVFHMDSKLVVEQMNGNWQMRSGDYSELFFKAHQLKWKFPNKKFVWIPREQNTEADELSTR